MRALKTMVMISLLVVGAGCYRTHYVNFSSPDAATRPSTVPVRTGGWQHFFLFGWVPGERDIDARELCGEADRIESVRTRQSFLQGLVRALTSFYINIYSPWDGAVYCTEQPPTGS